jgi:hypothetical protein
MVLRSVGAMNPLLLLALALLLIFAVAVREDDL